MVVYFMWQWIAVANLAVQIPAAVMSLPSEKTHELKQIIRNHLLKVSKMRSFISIEVLD